MNYVFYNYYDKKSTKYNFELVNVQHGNVWMCIWKYDD